MAKQNAIVRRLSAVETLGSTNVICTDKTGTLTKGEMTVTSVYVYDKFSHVTGLGYSLEGNVSDSNIDKKNLVLLAKTMVLCNDANMISEDKINAIGDPTEIALLVFGYKNGIRRDRIDPKFPRIREIPFTPERKMMTTIHQNLDNNTLEAYIKGACEIVLARCIKILVDSNDLSMSNEMKGRILAANNEMAKKGLRVLALAYKDMQESSSPQENIENNLMFLGLVGIMDPPRKEAIDSIAQCKSSGINVIMITGDHELTLQLLQEKLE